MSADNIDDATIRSILTTTRRIALVGASANPMRPSNEVLGVLLRRGYDVTPVNPGLVGTTLHGRQVVAALDDATPLEMVELFRNSNEVLPAVRDAIRLKARLVWMQLSVINEEAARLARAAGLTVVMDRCPLIEAQRLGLTT